MMLNNIGII